MISKSFSKAIKRPLSGSKLVPRSTDIGWRHIRSRIAEIASIEWPTMARPSIVFLLSSHSNCRSTCPSRTSPPSGIFCPFTEFYWVFIGCRRRWSAPSVQFLFRWRMLIWCWFDGFGVSSTLSGIYWAKKMDFLLGFAVFSWFFGCFSVLKRVDWVITWFYCCLPSFTEFYRRSFDWVYRLHTKVRLS